MTLRSIVLLLALVASACEKPPATTPPAVEDEISAEESAEDHAAAPDKAVEKPGKNEANNFEADIRVFERLDFGQPPAEVSIEGKLEGGLRWKDNTGENVLIFSTQTIDEDGEDGPARTTIMTADHRRFVDGEWARLRHFRQFISKCEYDTRADVFFGKDWSLDDLDQDGIMDVSFGWISDCSSDVSPATKKVIITSDSEKYALRGTTRVDPGDGNLLGGEKSPDSAFEHAPENFLPHAEMLWKKIGE